MLLLLKQYGSHFSRENDPLIRPRFMKSIVLIPELFTPVSFDPCTYVQNLKRELTKHSRGIKYYRDKKKS
jgi:hypothetical protein